MSPGKSPGFTFYPKDWLVDTKLLTEDQKGLYIDLLSYAWVGVSGFPQGYLPPDTERLARLVGLTPERWRETGAPVLELFENDGEGRLYHKRLLRELDKQKDRSKKGKRAAEVRWGNKFNARGSPSAMRLHPSSNASEADADEDAEPGRGAEGGQGGDEGKGRQEIPPDLGRLIERHPRPVDVAAARRAFLCVSSDLPRNGRIIALHAAWCESEDWREEDGRFVPPLSRWLLDRRWLQKPRKPAQTWPGIPPTQGLGTNQEDRS